jgi:hypothetical protein
MQKYVRCYTEKVDERYPIVTFVVKQSDGLWGDKPFEIKCEKEKRILSYLTGSDVSERIHYVEGCSIGSGSLLYPMGIFICGKGIELYRYGNRVRFAFPGHVVQYGNEDISINYVLDDWYCSVRFDDTDNELASLRVDVMKYGLITEYIINECGYSISKGDDSVRYDFILDLYTNGSGEVICHEEFLQALEDMGDRDYPLRGVWSYLFDWKLIVSVKMFMFHDQLNTFKELVPDVF